MMKFVATCVAAVALCGSAWANEAAVLSDIQGKVLVNLGEGFVPAQSGQTLGLGARVLVGAESLATLSFGDCAVSLDKPTVFTVKAEACKGAHISPVADISDGAPVAGAAGLAPFLLVGGAAAAAVGIGILVLDDKDDPLSN